MDERVWNPALVKVCRTESVARLSTIVSSRRRAPNVYYSLLEWLPCISNCNFSWRFCNSFQYHVDIPVFLSSRQRMLLALHRLPSRLAGRQSTILHPSIHPSICPSAWLICYRVVAVFIGLQLCQFFCNIAISVITLLGLLSGVLTRTPDGTPDGPPDRTPVRGPDPNS